MNKEKVFLTLDVLGVVITILMAILTLILFVGCGFNGNQQVSVSDSTQHVVTSGNTTFSIQFSFITEVEDLCKDSLGTIPFPTQEEYLKAVADCTFAKLAILSANPKQSLCSADRTGLTPEQLVQIIALCGS